jgi:valyl-tRNA synthetase
MGVGVEGRAIDASAETERLRDELRKAESELERAERKLSDARFVERAPSHLVEAEREKAARYGGEREALAARIAELE